MHIPKPKLGPFEINLNTVVVFVGFASGFLAWGYTLSQLETGRITNASNITRLEVRVERLEGTSRVLDNHELRINTVEKQAVDAANAMRAVETALSSLASDMRVTREILQRLERGAQGGRLSTPE